MKTTTLHFMLGKLPDLAQSLLFFYKLWLSKLRGPFCWSVGPNGRNATSFPGFSPTHPTRLVEIGRNAVECCARSMPKRLTKLTFNKALYQLYSHCTALTRLERILFNSSAFATFLERTLIYAFDWCSVKVLTKIQSNSKKERKFYSGRVVSIE